jgi:hypothetical protein
VKYSITKRQERRSAWQRILKILSLEPEVEGSVASLWSSYNIRTRGSNADEVIGIDLSPLSSGNYDVEVEVIDRTSGQATAGRTQIRVASELDL